MIINVGMNWAFYHPSALYCLFLYVLKCMIMIFIVDGKTRHGVLCFLSGMVHVQVLKAVDASRQEGFCLCEGTSETCSSCGKLRSQLL